MIRINDDYLISVEPCEFCVRADMHKVDEKGKEVTDILGHYGSLESAIKGVKNEMIRNCLSNGEYTLESALRCVVDINTEFIEILKKVMEQTNGIE